MNDTQFFQTRMGQQFYERTVPELVRQVERLADALEGQAQRPTATTPSGGASTRFQPGAQVYIESNPHHTDASGIVGELVSFHAGAGFMGCDLVEVRYQRLRDGVWHVMPFSMDAVGAGSREALLERAERLAEQAARLQKIAQEMA